MSSPPPSEELPQAGGGGGERRLQLGAGTVALEAADEEEGGAAAAPGTLAELPSAPAPPPALDWAPKFLHRGWNCDVRGGGRKKDGRPSSSTGAGTATCVGMGGTLSCSGDRYTPSFFLPPSSRARARACLRTAASCTGTTT